MPCPFYVRKDNSDNKKGCRGFTPNSTVISPPIEEVVVRKTPLIVMLGNRAKFLLRFSNVS